MSEAIDRVNQRAMAQAGAVRQYAAAQELEPSERGALDYLADEVRGRAILDLGIGGGRTVGPLRALSVDYLGIDYSEAMVAASRRAHPHVAIEYGDARDLSDCPADHFRLVFFSCNGIGMVGHVDRLRIFAAVRRVLAPDGAFVFSNHNRNATDVRPAFALPELELAPNALRTAVRVARFARDSALRVANRVRHLRHERATSEYAIINAASHSYGVMLYAIGLAEQRRQLATAGFVLETAFDLSGRVIADDTHDDSILYVARRASI